MELIRLQRELRDSSNRMQAMRTKCNAAEKVRKTSRHICMCVCVCVCVFNHAYVMQNLEAMKATHSKVLDEMEGLNTDMKRVRFH